MKGIIDIGSNTVRTVMYDNGKKIANYSLTSEIISDTRDGVLTPEGIARLCAMLETLRARAGECEVYAFATYAFRILKNSAEVKNEILKNTGIEIDILSGEDEAKYDFYGLMASISKNESGIGADLGGGSAQLFKFKKGELDFCGSYPIGCKKMKNMFFKGYFPTDEERTALENYVTESLPRLGGNFEKIYMMGGTAKTAAKLYAFLNGNENIDIMKTENLERAICFIRETPEEIMKNILKNRYDNIIAGIIIMETIARVCGAEKIHIKKCGVREGYLIKKGK